MRRGVIAALFGVLALPAQVDAQVDARAEGDAARQRALSLYRTARTLDSEGRTEEALPLAEEAYRLYPSAGARYALGLLHERLGQPGEAVRHFRMALAEARAPDDDLRAAIGAALERLDAPVEPLAPEPLPGTAPTPSAASELDAATPEAEPAAAPRTEPAGAPEADGEPAATDADEASAPTRAGLRLRAGVVTDAPRIERAWGASVAAGWVFDVGAFVELAVVVPSFGVLIAGGIEIGEAIVRPVVAAFVGVTPLRSLDGNTEGAAVFLGPRVGAALHPFDELGLSFGLDVSLAVDVTRADDGFVFSLPIGAHARWTFD